MHGHMVVPSIIARFARVVPHRCTIRETLTGSWRVVPTKRSAHGSASRQGKLKGSDPAMKGQSWPSSLALTCLEWFGRRAGGSGLVSERTRGAHIDYYNRDDANPAAGWRAFRVFLLRYFCGRHPARVCCRDPVPVRGCCLCILPWADEEHSSDHAGPTAVRGS